MPTNRWQEALLCVNRACTRYDFGIATVFSLAVTTVIKINYNLPMLNFLIKGLSPSSIYRITARVYRY